MTVAELFEIALQKLSSEPQTSTFLESVQTVQEIITNRLWMLKSELLEGDFEGSILATKNEAYLSSSILGLKAPTQPWVIYDGQRYNLSPLPDGLKDRTRFDTDGRPEFYRMRGRKITVYPATDLIVEIKAEAFLRPPKITSMSMELPWFGLFDQVFIDAVPRFGAGGLGLSATQGVALFLRQQVDMLAVQRPSKRIAFRYPA